MTKDSNPRMPGIFIFRQRCISLILIGCTQLADGPKRNKIMPGEIFRPCQSKYDIMLTQNKQQLP